MQDKNKKRKEYMDIGWKCIKKSMDTGWKLMKKNMDTVCK